MPLDLACPACFYTECRSVLKVDAVEAAQHFIHRGRDPKRNDDLAQHIRELWRQTSGEVYECERCGFGFAWPFIAGDAAFYNLASPNTKYPRRKWEFTRTLKALAERPTMGKTALEVGAGRGSFLDLLNGAKLLRLSDVSAIEYSDDALASLKTKGIATVSEDIRSARFANRPAAFDFIFMFQVLEHMDRLDDLFERFRTLLRPGGSVFIAVPNKTRTDYQERHGSQLDMPPNHIGRWTSEALRAICGRHELSVRALEIEPFEPVQFMMQDLAYSFVRRAQTSAGLSGFVRSLPRSAHSRLAQGLVAALLAPTRLPAWCEAAANRAAMGGSLWLQVDGR